ncbi:hypothetical protein [Mesorhizobium sp. CAU 1741]
MAQFTELSKKWTQITQDVRMDEEALAKVLVDEIWSKIDPATYGR